MFKLLPIPASGICPLSGEILNSANSMPLHCGPTVTTSFIAEHVLVEFCREFKTPCCPFCRNEPKFQEDLDKKGIRSTPFKPEDLTTLAGIKDILTSTSDFAFCALECKIENFEVLESAYLHIYYIMKKVNKLDNALSQDDPELKFIYLLAEKGLVKLIQLIIEDSPTINWKAFYKNQNIAELALKSGHPSVFLDQLFLK